MRAVKVIAAALVAAALSGCEKQTPVPEDKAVLDSYEVLLFLPSPDLNALVAHAAWLGQGALPPLLKAFPNASTNDQKRAKFAQLLEVLAWNGIRTLDTVKLLGGLKNDKQPAIRRVAINALFASATDLDKLKGYWDPGETDPERTTNPVAAMRLPSDKCREILLKLGVAIPKGPDGNVLGDPGRHFEPLPPVRQAGGVLHQTWSKETDPALRQIAAIQARRLGDIDATELLLMYLKPLPEGTRMTPQIEVYGARALRALQECTGQTFVKYEDWERWWNSVKPAPKAPAFTPPPAGRTPK